MKKVIAAVLLILIGLNLEMKGFDANPDSLISDIHYDYEIVSGENYGKDFICMGTLSMTIEVPDSTNDIALMRAKGPSVKKRYPPFYNLKRYLDISGEKNISVNEEGVRDSTYFRVEFYINRKAYYSSHYAVNDFIAPADLELLYGSNSLIELDEDDARIEVAGGRIAVKCRSKCKLDVVSIEGKSIYQGYPNHDVEIPLQPGVYIVRLIVNNNCVSKKVVIK
ncbi:MAG: T9SS type A sorting domain-containing protein [Bacteroides sp.]|nr:T9SS type A sorting domain-containing protein [Bacteroides sp.]